MTEKISNAFHSTLGGAKESLGKAVGSEQLISNGASERAQADARANANQTQAQVNKSQQQAQGLAENVTGRVRSTVGAATGNTRMQAEGNLQETAGNVRKTFNQ